MSNQIEIKIDGRSLTPEKFLSGANQFVALVQGVAKNVTGKKLDWLVEVDKGSAILRLKAANPNSDSENSISTVCRGVRSLRNGVKMIPAGFTRESVTSARILAGLVDGLEVQSISIRNGGDQEDIPHTVEQIADEILEGQPRMAFGSVEGKIVSLSAKHGYICVIDDSIQRREITCYLQTDQAQKNAIDGYTKRVLAKGLIHYAKEGHAVSITVDDVRIFQPDSDLPTLSEIQEIYKTYK